jgi:carnitine O-acetyltransferase
MVSSLVRAEALLPHAGDSPAFRRALTLAHRVACVQLRAGCKKLRLDRPLQWAFAEASAKLYAHMPSLPQLPIPPLAESLALYLESTKPFTTEASFAETKARVEAFGASGGLGERLQARLEAHRDALAANGESTSWLADWWDNLAYVDYRDSLPFYVSYFYAFADDTRGRTGQVERAASLIKGFAHARNLVQSGALAPEGSEKRGYLCSNGYKYLFNSCRIPGPTVDFVHCYDPSDPRAMEVTVSRKGQFFAFSMLGPDGRLLSVAAVEEQLRSIVEMAGSVNEPSLGALSAMDRDSWWQAREGLLRIEGNAEALEVLERSMFHVSLEDSEPVTQSEVNWSTLYEVQNRFCDKTINLLVYGNGKASFVGEHSKSDGSPTARLCDMVLAALSNGEFDEGAAAAAAQRSSSLSTPTRVPISFDGAALKALDAAEVSVLLYTVTLYANLAHSLTRSP